ncbi:MAG: 16S rRNA (adenine(1518)-N(6)/adenine(1519)-N(6))-dimethyltransferase RsmA [Actinomycetota bacterium]
MPAATLLTATSVRALARRHGFTPSQVLGQNFVVDPNTIRRIVRLAGVQPDDRVLEIGAGVGALTVGLSAEAASVIAVEIDRRVLVALHEVVDPLGNVEVVAGNAMALDLAALLGGVPHRLVANLPYNIATPLIAGVLERVEAVVDLVVMVQREVGERLVAGPGSKAYGAVSVLTAYHCERSLLGRVPPTVFWPVPAVDSVLVRLTRRPPPVAVDPGELMATVHAAFGQRRKTIRNSLSSVLGRPPAVVEPALATAGIDPGARAETLGLEAFARLTVALDAGGQP